MTAINYNDPQDQNAVNAIASKIFEKTRGAESALYHYKKLTQLNSIYAKEAGYKGLFEYTYKRGLLDSAFVNFQQYKKSVDSIQEITATEIVAQMHASYNYQLREKENIKLKEILAYKDKILFIATLIALVLMLSIIIALFYFRHKNLVLKIRIERKKRVETAIKLASFTEEYAHKEEELAKSHIAIRIKKILNDPDNVNKLLSEDDWTELERLIERLYPDFRERILEVSKLTSFKLHICLLLKAKIAIADIALLTQHSAEAITSARRRMAQKAFGENSTPVEWDDFIKSL
jgi:uncharacterized protein YxeA